MAFSEVYESVLKDYPDILSVEDLCKALKVSTKTGYRIIKENEIDHMKVGRSYRIPKAHLLTYMRVAGLETVNS
jgi:excisionase family DNA binding protein